ncbi:hypothetical protein D3C80_1770030 [compost metagenome]
MRELKSQCLGDALIQHFNSLIGQSEHQINRHIADSRLLGILQTAVDIICIMNTPDTSQKFILECLYAKTDPVHTAILHDGKLL